MGCRGRASFLDACLSLPTQTDTRLATPLARPGLSGPVRAAQSTPLAWDAELLRSRLPILAGQVVELPVTVHAKANWCARTLASEAAGTRVMAPADPVDRCVGC